MKQSKPLTFLLLFTLLAAGTATAQTIGQMGFIIKQALPSVETVAVIFNNNIKERVEREARSAVVITKLKVQIYGIDTRADIANQVQSIASLKNVAVIIVSDNGVMSGDSAKFIAQRLGMRKIPLFSDRKSDIEQGALVTVEKSGDELLKFHSNRIMGVLGVSLDAAFLGESTALD